MSSSSSDSDSDEFEPIRRIKINIRPKEDTNHRKAADVSEIKASVESWRPLGPPTHPSLTRRQSSLSSVSSMSSNILAQGQSGSGGSNLARNSSMAFANQSPGPSLQASPSCMSLVNDFNNRSSFSNFMPTMSRTSSPSMHLNQNDAIPIAIAIQESIDCIIKGIFDPNAIEPLFQSRLLGNIKIAFPNAFAKVVANGGCQSNMLRLSLDSTEKITKYYASRLIKDLDPDPGGKAERFINHSNKDMNLVLESNHIESSIKKDPQSMKNNSDLTSKHLEFDIDALNNHLRKMYEQSPASRYYNVDVLRYQIAPFKSIGECPLQVCAYWRVDADLVKMRIDFRHSSNSGVDLRNLREIQFIANFAQFIPTNVQNLDSGMNNNNSGALDMNQFEVQRSNMHLETIRQGYTSVMDGTGDSFDSHEPSCSQSRLPLITHQPKAIWNNSIKQLIWKFDTLSTSDVSSLFAKLDFRQCKANIPTDFLRDRRPTPIDIRFLVADSTLSNMAIKVDSSSYRLSYLKKESRSGRFKIEPYIL